MAWRGEWKSGVVLADPAEVVFLGTETKRHDFVMRVKEDGERLVADAVALIVCLVDLVAGQDHAEAGYVDCLPVEIHAGDPRARGAGGGVFVSVIDGGIPVQRACDGLGVGIENHLTGIKAMSGGGVIRAVERGGDGVAEVPAHTVWGLSLISVKSRRLPC